MHTITIYVANDGTKFEGPNALAQCRAYEQEIEEQQLMTLEQYIKFFDWKGNPLSYSYVNRNAYSVYYALVLGIPDEDEDPEAFRAWERVVPSELDEEICSYECGWYVGNGECVFHAWEQVVKDYTEQADIIGKLSEGN